MKVVLIGTGNTATVLGRLIHQSGHTIIQVYGRSEEAAILLANKMKAGYCTSLQKVDPGGDLYIIAVSDTALTAIADQWTLPTKLIVHTAGSVSKEVLKKASKNYGVLYPLQSLRKEANELPVIPFLVDGNTSDDLTLLYDFAGSLSSHVQKAGDDKRKQFHLAAVMLNNFTNHLYTLTKEYCDSTKTDFSFLLPLIQQLPKRLADYSPQQLQTGPAIRNDQIIIDEHIALLQQYPEIKTLYTLFTKSIQDYYKIK